MHLKSQLWPFQLDPAIVVVNFSLNARFTRLPASPGASQESSEHDMQQPRSDPLMLPRVSLETFPYSINLGFPPLNGKQGFQWIDGGTGGLFDLTSAFDEFLKSPENQGREETHKFFFGFVSEALRGLRLALQFLFLTFDHDNDDRPSFDAWYLCRIVKVQRELIDRIRRSIQHQNQGLVTSQFIETLLHESGIRSLLHSATPESLLAAAVDERTYAEHLKDPDDGVPLQITKEVGLKLAKYSVHQKGLTVRDNDSLISRLRNQIEARISAFEVPRKGKDQDIRASGDIEPRSLHIDEKAHTGRDQSRVRRSRSGQIWKHITISRDETSASDFLQERVLILFFKRHFRIKDNTDIANGSLKNIQGSKIPQKEQHLLSFTHLRPAVAAEEVFPRQMPYHKALSQFSSEEMSSYDIQINDMESGIQGNSRYVTKGNGNELATGSPESAQHRELVRRVTSVSPEDQYSGKTQGTSGNWKIIHLLPQPMGQPSAAYLDQPVWAPSFGRDNFRLKAFLPVSNVQEYVQQSGIDFTISRFYSEPSLIPELRRTLAEKQPPPHPRHYHEQIHLHSQQMVETLQEFFTYQPDFLKHFPNFNVRAPISAPYIFWYTSRSTASLEQLSHPHQDLMRTLTSWIDRNYNEKYAEAQSHLENGVVTLGTMPFLLCPGDVLVWKEKGKTKAAVTSSEVFQKSPPILYWDNTQMAELGNSNNHSTRRGEFSTTWAVNVWSYRFNGEFLRDRRSTEIKFRASSLNQEVEISKLSVYPLRFADEKTKLQLETRGKTFWTCRYRNLVSHTGEEGLFTVSGPCFHECHSAADCHGEEW